MATPRIRSVAASEAEQVFREFVAKLARLHRPAGPQDPAHAPNGRGRMNGHLRPGGSRGPRARRRP